MSDRDVWRTGFGDVGFGIVWGGSLGMPDWQQDSLASTRHVPGSNRNITQLLGLGPKRATYRLWLDATADFRALAALVQTTDTLTLYAEMTTEADTYVDLQGRGYVQVDATLLGLANTEVRPDGRVQVDATFERPSG